MSAAPQERTASASIADLRPQPQRRDPALPTVRAGFSDLEGFELAQRAAKALAASSLVPQNYQGNLADCIVALELAQRIGASPLMVMQNLYIVHGRPAWSSQFLIAAVNQCGRYTALQYEWKGTPNTDDWTCRAFAKDKATGERVQGAAVSIAMAKKEGWYGKNGSKWQTIPELMLMYRAATFFARTNAPELTMGLKSQEEAYDVIDVTETAPGQFETSVQQMKETAAAAEEKAAKPPEQAQAPAEDKPKRKRTDDAKGPPAITDEAVALLEIDNAKEEGDAAAILERCKDQPFYGRAVAGFNNRFSTTV